MRFPEVTFCCTWTLISTRWEWFSCKFKNILFKNWQFTYICKSRTVTYVLLSCPWISSFYAQSLSLLLSSFFLLKLKEKNMKFEFYSKIKTRYLIFLLYFCSVYIARQSWVRYDFNYNIIVMNCVLQTKEQVYHRTLQN